MFDITSGVVELLGIPQQFDGAAALAAGSDAGAAAVRVQPAAAATSGASVLSAGGTLVAVAAFAGSSAAVAGAAGTLVAVAGAAVSGESVLSADATRIVFGASLSVGPSVLVAAAVRVVPGSAGLASASTAVVSAVMVAGGAAGLTASSSASSVAVIAHTVNVDALSAQSVLAPVSALPIYRLVQPTVEVAYSDNVLLSRFAPDTALSVIVNGTVVTVTDYPNTVELDEADAYYLGGRRYQLSEVEYQRFVAAGRTDLIEVA